MFAKIWNPHGRYIVSFYLPRLKAMWHQSYYCIKRSSLSKWFRVFGVIAILMSSFLQYLCDHCVKKSSKSCCASFLMSIVFMVQLLITMNCFHCYSSYRFGCVCDFSTFDAFHPSWKSCFTRICTFSVVFMIGCFDLTWNCNFLNYYLEFVHDAGMNVLRCDWC